MVDPKAILSIKPMDYVGTRLSEEEILDWFGFCDAAWVHDGDPQKPHAELTSGLCSNGFFDCLRVLCFPNLSAILANQLYEKLRDSGIGRIDWVVGSPYAAITFSHDVARLFNARHGFLEKAPIHPETNPKGKKLLWQRMTIAEDETVLSIEELTTTSGTLQEVRRAIEEGNEVKPVNFLPVVGMLVHRPPKLPADYSSFGVQRVVALIEKEVWAVPPEECPLCRAGSKRLRPKTHWKELTGKA